MMLHLTMDIIVGNFYITDNNRHCFSIRLIDVGQSGIQSALEFKRCGNSTKDMDESGEGKNKNNSHAEDEMEFKDQVSQIRKSAAPPLKVTIY